MSYCQLLQWYTQQPVKVLASSEQCDPHTIVMSRIDGNRMTPYVHLT